MIAFLSILCVFSQITDITPSKKWDLEIVTKKTDQYYLLTRNTPITFSVEGPTYLRVYTRIFWPVNAAKQELYKMILQENEIDERIITLESERSSVTTDTRGRPVSKWRTFYIEVPNGLNRYKITHWSSPNDSILLKFTYESPKEWRDIPAAGYSAHLEAVEEEKLVKYYEVLRDNKVTLRLQGPVNLKVVSRLNYDMTMLGEQSYSVLVNDNGRSEQENAKCYKSDVITYENRPDVVPSNAHTFYVTVDEGLHNLEFILKGTTAKSAALRFLREK
jgi:hypothetical protein